MLLSTATTGIQSAKAQTTVGENVLGSLTNVKDQIVKGGNHIVDHITKGGIGFLTSVSSSLPNLRVHINTAYQDMVKGDSAGTGTELKELNADFINDSSLVYGLGQEVSQIAQNNSAPMDSHSKQMLSAIGTDLKNIALNSQGVLTNTTSNSPGASNSTVSK
jgi:paraquat-inducible protein B